jgi:signal transduction histidine kinase/ActR/RegA family two-component response regulator
VGTRLRPGEGIAGWVAQHGEPLLIREGLANDARFQHLPQREELRSSVCVPVRSRPGATIGVLCLNTSRSRRRFSHRDLTLMLIYAGAVGTLIEAARALEGERRTRRQLERAFNRQRATEGQLIQSAKMAAVGLLASGIAHEFNNLLTGILGMAQIAQDTKSPRHVERALRVAVDNCRKASDVVKNLLSFAKPYSKPGSAVDAAAAIDTVLALVNREIASRGIRVVRRLQPAPPARATRGGLEQVLLNLILNAVQAMEGRRGSVLTVSVRRRRAEVVLSVADTGHGIKRENLGRIFDPFFSTKSLLAGQAQPQGAGLGLSVSYGIVRAFGGRFRVRSRVHRGTLFAVRLPVATEGDAAEARPQTRRLPRVAGGRVLVVDDEWWIREFLRECLTHAGYEVAVAGDAAEALAAAQDRAPDAMLVDLVLTNGERGDDVVAELRRAAPAARVLYMTGRVAGDEFEQRLRNDSDGFLAKPFEAHEVVAALQLALGDEEPRR